jgi:hypothetical protein
VLHLAPERILKTRLSALPNLACVTADLDSTLADAHAAIAEAKLCLWENSKILSCHQACEWSDGVSASTGSELLLFPKTAPQNRPQGRLKRPQRFNTQKIFFAILLQIILLSYKLRSTEKSWSRRVDPSAARAAIVLPLLWLARFFPPPPPTRSAVEYCVRSRLDDLSQQSSASRSPRRASGPTGAIETIRGGRATAPACRLRSMACISRTRQAP